MLTVAPIGRTKEEVRFETPTFPSTAPIVTGSVASEELVEKAMASGSVMFRKWIQGLMRPRSSSRSGSVMNRCTVRPRAIVSM